MGYRVPKEEKRGAARVCFLAGKKLEGLVVIWEEGSREEKGQDGNYGVRARAVQSLIGKAVAFLSAVGFVEPGLGSSAGTYPLAPLYDLFLEYAPILAAQGTVSEAVRYVERVLAGYGDVQWSKGAFEKKAEVKPAPAPAPATISTTADPHAASYGVSSYSGYNPPPAPAGPYDAAPTSVPCGAPLAPSTGPYEAPAPSNYGATPVTSTGSYDTPPAPSGPYARRLEYLSPTQSLRTDLKGDITQHLHPVNKPGMAHLANKLPPPPSSMVPVPPPPIDQLSGPPPLELFPPLHDAISPLGTTLRMLPSLDDTPAPPTKSSIEPG
ncbi:putative protein transporter SEC31, partial [Rhizoctonia solani 123E]